MTAPVRSSPPPRSRAGVRTGGRGIPWPLWTSGWTQLPLRLFLGVTFLYAGLQKFADRSFLKASSPGSIQVQLHAAVHASPIGSLLGGLAHHAALVGVLIGLAELAVGAGVLGGLWTRGAAAGGLALSVGFLLTVSWHVHPYYLGPDIVFAAAFVPLVLAGAGEDPRLSVDAYLRRRSEDEFGVRPAQTVPVPFSTVQRLCGGYEAGYCHYRRGAACRAGACPVLAVPPVADPVLADELDRRTFLYRSQLAGLLAVGGLAASGGAAGVGRLLGGKGGGSAVTALQSADTVPGTDPPSTRGAGPPAGSPRPGTPAGVAIGPAVSVPVGGVGSFTDPSAGTPAYVVQPSPGRYVGLSAICTHAGCQVQWSANADQFVCPCHGARFDPTGAVVQGPAARNLRSITVTKGADGQLYAAH